MNEESPRPLLGWREWVSLPDLGIPWIKAKVDTGARSSSLQAESIERFRSAGADRVRFVLHPLPRHEATAFTVEADLLDVRSVKSSTGVPEDRPTIRTLVRLGDDEWPVVITLAKRADMRFRMLLGRSAIAGRFRVDPGLSYQVGKRPLDLPRTRSRS
jgi:hypothetical protein